MASGDCGCSGTGSASTHGHGESSTGGAPTGQAPLEVRVEPFGPHEEIVARARESLLHHPQLGATLRDGDHRLLSFQLINRDTDPCGERTAVSTKPAASRPLDGFVATLYDYSENGVIEATGPLHALDSGAPDCIAVRTLGHQPAPDADEFAAAVDVVMHNRELREMLQSERIAAYRPMPPVLLREQPDGRIERTLTVGLRSTDEAHPHHEIVAVRMFDRSVLRGLDDLPRAGQRVCEPPPGRDTGSARASGQCSVTITSGGETLWTFLAIRPGASSGTNGSGIELRDVRYRGKSVLYQAHVPILNVEYGQDGQAIGCGPTYRDWQNAETQFEANGNAVAPGFVLCPQPARTIIDSNSDQGNFAGVAIYVTGPEVVLVSEMSAGWYRYITEWRFHANGTLRPRFGFAGTENPCTCHLHKHHVYWRFDFDIRTPGHNVVDEFNDPPIVGNSNWHTKQFEIRRARDTAHKRRWRVRNTMTNEAYEVRPGADDGVATAYGIGDLFVLRYHGGEIDDGQGFTTDANLSRAHIVEKFMTPPESVVDTDVVVWYAAHYVHDAGTEVGNWVGPDLVPMGW